MVNLEHILLICKYIFLGLLQGLTEPIPVSSSGHLVLAEYFLGLKVEGFSFELLVNFASLLAVLLIYKKDFINLINHSLLFVVKKEQTAKKDFYYLLLLVLATIPVGIIGFLFNDYLSTHFKSVRMVAVGLLLTGIALYLIRNLKGTKDDNHISFLDAVFIGLFQVIALAPGISRSGATVVGSMARGLKRETALRFSFFLYMPVSFGGVILSLKDVMNDPNFSQLILPYLFAFISSFVATYFSLKWFIKVMQEGKLKYFTYYCFIVGFAIFIFA